MGRREPPGAAGVPVHLTRLVGREVVLDELPAALEGTRLLTLTAAPGCGKSRLAAELGRRLAPDVPGGVWWVALALLDDPAHVARGVSLALDVPEAPGPRDA